jgi:hypothetical protein
LDTFRKALVVKRNQRNRYDQLQIIIYIALALNKTFEVILMKKLNPTRYSSAVGEVWVMATFKTKYCHKVFDIPEVVKEEVAEVVTLPKEEVIEEITEEKKPFNKLWLVPILTAVILVVWLIWVFKKKK